MGDKLMININRILPVYYFTLECLFLFFLLFLFYTRIGAIPSVLSFVGVILVSYVVLLYGLKLQKVSGTLPFIGAILSGVVAYIFDFTLMSVFLCTIFLFFRLSAFFKDSSLWKEERPTLAILFYCSGFIIFLEGWIFKYPYMNWLFGIVIGFTILLSVGNYLRHLEGSKGNRNVSGIASAIGIAVLLTGMVTLLLPVVKWLLKNIFEGLTLLIGILLMPLFKLVESIGILQLKLKNQPKDEFEQAALTKEKSSITEEIIYNMPIWVWFVLLIVLLLIAWYFIRKIRMVDENSEDIVSLEGEHAPTMLKMEKRRRFFREPAPQEYLRKLFYQLQLYAEKHGLGRYDHETIREWFDRVGFQKNEELFKAYESVRYGGNVILKHDAKHFEDIIQGIKLEMKERTNKKGREA